MKKIVLIFNFLFISLFAENCEKNTIKEILDIDANIIQIVSIEKSSKILPGFCKVVTTIRSNPGSIDIIFVEPKSDVLVLDANIVKKEKNKFISLTLKEKISFKPIIQKLFNSYLDEFKQNLNKDNLKELNRLYEASSSVYKTEKKLKYKILSFSRDTCINCTKQKSFLKDKNVNYSILDFSNKNPKRANTVQEIANELGVIYTPFNFIIDNQTGKVVDILIGFNPNKLNSYIKEKMD